MRTLVGYPELFIEPAHQEGLWTYLDYLVLDKSWRWNGDKILFHQVMQDLCIFYPISRSTRVISPCDDRRPQYGTNVMPNVVEMKARQNPFCKWGRMEISTAPVGLRLMGISQTPNNLLNTPAFPYSHWIGWGLNLQMNRRTASTQ